MPNLLMAPFFLDAVATRQASWRTMVRTAVEPGIPVPAMSVALAYFDGYRSARVPANMIQTQRDYFGVYSRPTIAIL